MDPNGRWQWEAYGSIPHGRVEEYYMGASVLTKQVEFRIPKPGISNNRYWNKVDMFNSLAGDTWEVEPWFLANHPGHGVDQATKYVGELNIAARNGLLEGKYIFVVPYNWNDVTFVLGRRSDWPGRLVQPILGSPMIEFVADYQAPGLIVFWIRPSAAGVAVLALGGKLVFDRARWSRRLLRPPDWQPQPVFDLPIPDPIPLPNPIFIPVSLPVSIENLCLPQILYMEMQEINLDA